MKYRSRPPTVTMTNWRIYVRVINGWLIDGMVVPEPLSVSPEPTEGTRR